MADDKKDDCHKPQKREQEELDEGLEESFPASDPPANTQPGHDRPMPSSGYDEEE